MRRRPGDSARAQVHLLDADPDLGQQLSPREWILARRAAVAALRRVPLGRWAAADCDLGELGCIVLDGALVCEVALGDRRCAELVGPEDFVRPWQDPEPLPGLSGRCEWTVIEPVRLAVLDARFAAAGARWPALLDELLARCIRRARHLVQLRALASVPRLDARLLLLLRLLGERWGRVSPDGVTLSVPLKHATIARLAGAQRPSVSTALSHLMAAGHVRRTATGAWLLPHESGELEQLWTEIRRGADLPGPC